MPPAWAVHLRPGSEIPLDDAQARRYLRRGNLPSALMTGGAQPALQVGASQLTHDQLAERVASIAGRLARLGIEREARVALYAESSLNWILAYLAVQLLGAVAVPFNPAYRSAEAEHILRDAEPTVVLVDRERQATIESLQPRLPHLRHVITLENLPSGRSAAASPRPRPASPAVILYTSGTTGRPKGALLDNGNLLAQARGVIEAWRWDPNDRLVVALPLFHVHGLAIALHGTLLSGASATIVPFTPENVVRELRAGATMFFGVPAMYHRLAEHLEQHPADLSRVRLFVAGSAPLPPALFERCERMLGQPVLERYGITEGGIVVSNLYDGPRRAGRVGYPLPGVEVRLGEQDEILLKGGQVFSRYWRNQAATREIFQDGWMRTGDVGEIAEDGTLAIRGRLKELIISGGFNVYPREVELVLETHPHVTEVAVVGLPSERWGEEVTAFVVADGAIQPDELIRYTRERLAPYKCPRGVRFIDALPRNAMGKVQRSLLG